MVIESEDHAITLLNNTQLSYKQRELAVYYLAEHPTPRGIKQLVRALLDDEFAIRWVASTALAQLGPTALPEVLRALTNPELNTARLRECVTHILHYSSSLAFEPVYKHRFMEPMVYIKPGIPISMNELITALKGSAADISSMKAAGKLLLQLESHPAN